MKCINDKCENGLWSEEGCLFPEGTICSGFIPESEKSGVVPVESPSTGWVAPLCHMKPMRLDAADDYPNGQVTYWECEICGHTKEYSRNPPRV